MNYDRRLFSSRSINELASNGHRLLAALSRFVVSFHTFLKLKRYLAIIAETLAPDDLQLKTALSNAKDPPVGQCQESLSHSTFHLNLILLIVLFSVSSSQRRSSLENTVWELRAAWTGAVPSANARDELSDRGRSISLQQQQQQMDISQRQSAVSERVLHESPPLKHFMGWRRNLMAHKIAWSSFVSFCFYFLLCYFFLFFFFTFFVTLNLLPLVDCSPCGRTRI